MSTATVAPALQTGHVGLNVVDLDRSTSFYVRLLGLAVLGESSDAGRRYAFLGLDGTPLLTLWQQSEGRFVPDRPGLHHFAWQVPDVQAVKRAEATLRELGATVEYDGIVRHEHGSDSSGVFFSDPDGIRMEIYAPTGAGDAPAPTDSLPACGFF